MSTWTQYPNRWGWYREMDGLVLTARENGAWSVHDPLGETPAKCSTMAPALSPGLERAMRSAESAAKELLERTTTN
jgi:hypothetical protein